MQTNLAVVVRHAPNLNGNGRIEGSAQQLLGEDVTLNGGFTMTGDLLVPGTPALRLNGLPTFAGTIGGNGSDSPGGYCVILNGGCSLRYLRTRTAPVSLPTVPVPPQPFGTRNVTVNTVGQSIGNPATLRNLTLNGNMGQVLVPPGTYGSFTANGGSGFTLGVAGAVSPAVYGLQSLNLNGQSRVDILGPVILTVADGFSANGVVGTTNHSFWLQLQIARGGFTLNGGCAVHANVTAPAGSVIINGNSCLNGSAQCDRLVVNGGGVIRAGATPNQPPVANSQSLSVDEDTPLNLTLTGSDPEGAPLIYIVLSQPIRGTLTPQPLGGAERSEDRSTLNQFTYLPGTNFYGSDSFTFKVNDGQADSAAATISITVRRVNHAPIVSAGPDQTNLFSNPVQLIGTVADDGLPPGSELRCVWQMVAGPGTVDFDNANAASTRATSSRSGVYRLGLTASDGLASNTAVTTIVVDQPPVVTVTSPAVITWPGNELVLNGTVVDDGLPAGCLLTERWSQVNGSGAVEFIPAIQTNALTGAAVTNQPATLARFSAPGVFVLRLTADDGFATNQVEVSVKVNRPPMASAQMVNTLEDTPTPITLSAVDADEDPLAFALVTPPAHGDLSGLPPDLIYRPAMHFSGTDSFTFLASDGQVESAPAVVSISVAHLNLPPTASITLPAPQSEFPTGQTIPVSVAASDPDGRVVQVRVFGDGELLAELADAPFDLLWTNAAAGDHVLWATATDDAGATSVSANVLISVVSPESGDFVVDAGPDQVILLPDAVSLTGTIEVPGVVAGSETNVFWSKASGPGSVWFTSPDRLVTTAQFGEPGTYTLKLRVACAGGTRSDTLTVDALPAPSERLTAARSSRGAEFWLMFLPNMSFGGELAYVGCELIVSADVDTVGKVTFSRWAEPQEVYFHVQAGAARPVSLWDYPREDWAESDSVQANGIHITADHPVTVYGLNYMPESADGFLALPTSMLGTNYLVLAYRNSPAWYDTHVVIGGTQFGVVAPENDTRVTITPTAATSSRPAGEPYEIVLQRGETYRSINEVDSDADFTGTTISSDKPVAVFAGSRGTLIPAGYAAADHLVEQLPPLEMWGREFVTFPLASRTRGDTFRFLAQTNATSVAINGNIVATLDRGQFHEQLITGPAQILSSQPILVAQYANSSDYDGSTGDPFMTLIPPFEQFGGEYVLTTAPLIWNLWDRDFAEIYTNYLNLVVRTNGMGLIQLDGVAVPASQFQVITNTGYAGAQLPVDTGAHQLRAPVPFGSWVYGWAPYVSYAFMGGVYSETVAAGTQLALEQPTASAAVGREKFVTARVTDACGRPLMDVGVDFAVTGANPTAGHMVSSRFGEATFAYPGTNAGVDVITATLVDLERSVTNSWIFPTENSPPLASTAGTPRLQFGFTAQLLGTVTDDGRPSGANLDLRWIPLAGPAEVQLEDPAQLSTRAFCTEPGTYAFALVANDSQFCSRDVVTIFVDQLPGVQFPEAEIPAVTTVGAPLRLAADAWDWDGSIERVEFYGNDVLFGTATNCDLWTGYTIDWIPSTNGCFGLRAVAFDDLGGSVASDIVLLHVTFPPQIEATLPDGDLTLPYGESATRFKARAWEQAGTVTNLAVYVGPMLVCQAAGDQLDFTGPADVGGGFYEKYGAPYPLRFVATDEWGVSTEMDSFNITLLPPDITVNWVSPVQDQMVRVGQTVNLVAEASVTPPAQISQVVFYRWCEPPPWLPWASGTWNWVDYPATEPPYSNHWIPPAPGDYQFKALACADTETAEPTPIITIRVLPAIGVSILSPDNSAQWFTGHAWQISLALDDPTGAFDHAEFFANGFSLGQTTNSFLAWTPSQTGNYTLTATVYDHQGQSYNPDYPVSVQVNPPPVPEISLRTVPRGRTNAIVGSPLLLVAEVSLTNPALVTKVEFFADNQSLGEITNAPFVFSYLSTNPGPHILTARATTDYGTAADSLPLSVESGLRLGVVWEGVRAGEWVPVGTNKTLGVRLHDPGSIFDHVEFLANGAVQGSTARCFMDWTPAVPGDYTMRARAHDRFGNTYDSEDITLHSAVLQIPQVHFLSPLPMTRFSSGAPVSFLVKADGPDSAVTNLSLFRYSRPQISVGGDTLGYAWTNLPAGKHPFTAVATDDKGLTGEATVRIIVDLPVAADLLPPQNLAARVLGCNAIRISWDTNSGSASDFVVVERAEGTNEIWELAGKVPLPNGAVENHFLHAATIYRYHAYVWSATGYRSVDSNVVVTRTRAYVSGFAVVDLAESLEDSATFSVAATGSAVNGNSRPMVGPRCRAAMAERTCNRKPLSDPQIPLENCSKAAADSTGCLEFVSFDPQQSEGAEVFDLNAISALGISDLNSVLLVGGFANYLWSPTGTCQALTNTNFYPFRLTRSGVPVGTRYAEIPVAPLIVVTQLHAGFWENEFVDLTPQVQALRFPMSAPPLTTPYSVYDVLADMNASGAAVGTASWVWVTSYDGQISWLRYGPVRRATFWPGNNQPPVDFGALQELDNVSESAFQAINDAGDIVGVSAVYDPDRPEAQITHAVRSHVSLAETPDARLADLGTLGGLYSAAIAINQSGIAVGYSTLRPEDAITNTRAVYWLPTENRPRSLPGYTDDLLTYAHAIDDDNQIVGEAVDGDGVQQAVLWKPISGATNGLDYDLLNLNDLVCRSDWSLTSAHGINRSGFIVGSGWHCTRIVLDNGAAQIASLPRAFLLIPDVSLAVDYNRDGRIELNHNDDLPGQQPYQFWVNDDSDNSTVDFLLGISDLPGARSGLFEFDNRDPDFADHQINGAADLVDWFPVYLNISNLLAIFPPSQCEYRLLQADGALNFLYTNLRPETAGSYLTNALTTGFGNDFSQPAATATGIQQVTADGVALSAVFLDQIARGGGVLICEARQPTTQPLRLEVRNRRRLVTALELPLRITGAEAMYGWANLRGVAGENPKRLTDLRPPNWPAFADEHQAFVFLHGYNVNERQSRAWAAEMFKRLWWSGSHRRFYGVSWRGADTQVAGQTTINYHGNVRHAFETAPVLANLINTTLSGQDVTVAAHSLGNMVVCSAIQDYGALPDRYFMVDAAVAMEAFDAGLLSQPFMTHPDWRDYPERLYASEWYRLFPDDDGRHALTWRGRFADVPRLTALYNFYSSGEEVLQNRVDEEDPEALDLVSFHDELGDPHSPLIGQNAWNLQELLKGRATARVLADVYLKAGAVNPLLDLALYLEGVRAGNVLGSQFGGWGFNGFWDSSGSLLTVNVGITTLPLYISGGHMASLQTENITDDQLRTNSFFLSFFDPRLYQPEGSALAADPATATQLLAEQIPARTFAVGANQLVDNKNFEIGTASFNMNKEYLKRDWPAERQNSIKKSRWLHSDLHDVAYLHNGLVFDKFIELEGGR